MCVSCCVLQALDAAIRRHDPHALDALLMQFAAVIVSTTGAEVDRMEREIMVGSWWWCCWCCCCCWLAASGAGLVLSDLSDRRLQGRGQHCSGW